MGEIYPDREDAARVQACLAKLDAASKDRKSKPEIYKRMFRKKAAIEERQKSADASKAASSTGAKAPSRFERRLAGAERSR